jgi:hypothetical protein
MRTIATAAAAIRYMPHIPEPQRPIRQLTTLPLKILHCPSKALHRLRKPLKNARRSLRAKNLPSMPKLL